MISLDEFNNLPDEEKKNILQTLKTEVGIKEIIETWGISRAKLYNLQNKLGLSNGNRRPGKTKEKKTNVTRGRAPRNLRAENHDILIPPDAGGDSEANETKFSLQLETTGPASLLVDTLKMILLSERVAHLTLKVNIQIEQV